MRLVPAFAIVFAVVLVLSPSSAKGGTLSAPRLTVGDTWTYRTNTSLGPDFFLDGQVTLTVIAHEPIPVEGSEYDAYRLAVAGSGTAAGNVTLDFGVTLASGSWILTGREILESGGLKTIASVLDLEANGTLHTRPLPLPFQLSVQNTSSRRLMEDDWRFPLEVGTSVTVGSRLNFSEDVRLSFTSPIHEAGVAWSNVTYALEAEVVVDAPAGRFNAFRIRQAYVDGTSTRSYYAPNAGNDVRTESYNGTDPIGTSELVSYRYQALEPPRFLGLTASDWTIGIVLLAASAVAIFLLRRWRRGPPTPRADSSRP